eukprot:1947814-Amphidinium_carterae.2
MRSQTAMVWSAIPCTGGTRWRRLNDSKHADDPDYRRKMRQHDKTLDALWDNFVQIGEHCLSAKGIVFMEWLTRCTYWQKRRVKAFLKLHHLRKVDFHGSAVWLTSKAAYRASSHGPW